MDGFPTGHYTVKGYADFYIEPNGSNENKEDIKVEAQIGFDVEK